MALDTVLIEVGEFGRFQQRIYFLVCLACVVSAIQTFLPVFTLGIPKYRCQIPNLPNDSYKIQDSEHRGLIEIYIPTSNIDGQQAWSSCDLNDLKEVNLTMKNTTTNSTYPCDAWVYDRSNFGHTVVTEFNLVCGREIYRSHLNMLISIGYLVGSLGLGFVSDLFGRKRTFTLTLLIRIITDIVTGFAPNYASLAVLRFLTGAFSFFSLGFVTGMEFVGPSKRTLTGILLEFFWCSGIFLLALVAFFVRDWRYLQVSLSLVSLIFLPYWWCIPESPRWLYTRGRIDEADKIIQKIARVNKTYLSSDYLINLSEEEAPRGNVLKLFKDRRFLSIGIILYFNWFVINAAYYALSLNTGNLSGGVHFNFAMSTVAELASYVLCIVMLYRIGRKTFHCALVGFSGVACFATIFPVMFGGLLWMRIALSLLGKFGVSAAFAVLYMFSAELFPTVLRQSSFATCTVVGSLGSTTAPYIADLGILVGGKLTESLPVIVIGAVTLFAALLSLLLPETKNKNLPDTARDIVQMTRLTIPIRQTSDL